MKKKVLALALFSVLCFVLSPAALYAGELHYITSESDVWLPRDHDGLTVYLPFYEKVSRDAQRVIEMLVAYELSIRGGPVFVYGEPFNHVLAKKLLKDEDGIGCRPAAYAGLFQFVTAEGKLAKINMCGADL